MADPVRPRISLRPDQITQLRAITNNGTSNFSAGYKYIYGQISGDSRFDANTKYWFQQAPQINAGAGSSALFIRNFTANGLRNAGRGGVNVSEMSDNIARAVLGDILSTNGVDDLSKVLHLDIAGAIQGVSGKPGIANIGGWGGSFYYWNLQAYDSNNQPIGTIGDQIKSDSAARALFIATLGDTLAQMATPGNLQMLGDSGVRSALGRLFDLPNDMQDAVFARTRQKSDTFHGLWVMLFGAAPGDAASVITPLPMYLLNGASADGQLSTDASTRDKQLDVLISVLELIGTTPENRGPESNPTSILEALNKAARQAVDLFRGAIASIDPAEFGDVLGSSLGNYLSHGDPLKGIAYSSLLGEFGKQLGTALKGGNLFESVVTTARNGAEVTVSPGTQFAARLEGAAIGSVSSLLSAELANAIGLRGFGADFFSAAAGSVLQAVITDTVQLGPANIFAHLNFAHSFDSFNGGLSSPGVLGLASAVSSFLGAKLGSLIVQPQTQAAVALSSLGSAAGSYAAVSIALSQAAAAGVIGAHLTLFGSILLPGVGALVGFVLGALIGNLFGAKKPRTPTASAETVLQLPYAHYELGAVASANAGNVDLVKSMALTAMNTLNGLIANVVPGDATGLVSNLNGQATDQRYGHNGNQIYVKINGVEHDYTSADQAVEYGALTVIKNTKIIGGNIFAKRAIYRSPADSLTAFAGDLKIADDYNFFARNRDLIQQAIVGAYSLSQADQNFYATYKEVTDRMVTQGLGALNQAELNGYYFYKDQFDRVIRAVQNQSIANPWIITLQRANELSLDKWAPSDFYGGLKGFLDSFLSASSDAHYEDVDMTWLGGPVSVSIKDSALSWQSTSDVESIAAKVYRMYDLTLGRAPNGGEVAYWSGVLEHGTSLEQAAAMFLGDASVQARWGATDNVGFTAQMYRFAFRREAFQGELDGWSAALNSGALTRAGMLAFFSEYIGHRAFTDGVISQGISYIDRVGSGLFSMLSSATPDGRQVTIDNLLNVSMVPSWGPYLGGANEYVDAKWSQDSLVIDDNVSGQQGGDDIFVGGQAGDTIRGQSGDDWLDGQGGADLLEGGDGRDVLLGGSGSDRLFGGDGDDYLAAGDGNDSYNNNFGVSGGAGNDTLVGGAGEDWINGDDGDDTFILDEDGGGVWDWMDGGSGSDTASFERFNNSLSINFLYKLNAGPNFALEYGDTWVNIENITGTRLGDWIGGDDQANVLRGLAGNDEIHGWGGDDVIEGGAGGDYLLGEGGTNTLSYEHSPDAVFVDMSTGAAFGGDAEGDGFVGFTVVRGSRFDDELKGDWQTNALKGGDGNDRLDASGGGDTYDGGEGFDTLDFSSSGSAIGLWSGSTLPGQENYGFGWAGEAAGSQFTKIDAIVGSAFDDNIQSGDGDQVLDGGAGNDILFGDGGDASLTGSDTYIYGKDYGIDEIVDNNRASNTLRFTSEITVHDLFIIGQANGTMWIGDRGSWQYISIDNEYQAGNNVIRTLDFGGAGQVDLSFVNWATGGGDAADYINSPSNQSSLVLGAGGNDGISVGAGAWSNKGNVIIGGLGDDQIFSSTGDDQFAFDRGDGHDRITDTGGEDTLVFGPTVAAGDVIFKIDGDDLVIGVRDLVHPDWDATQVADSVRMINGGYYEEDQDSGARTIRTMDYVMAGGTTIDLRKLDIPWGVHLIRSGNHNPVGPGFQIPPIVFDLQGDGLDLTGVNDSKIVAQTKGGVTTQLSWVGPTDGMLAFDRNGDGQVDRLSEITFTQDKAGATTDLEGLTAWDTNGDGLLDASDDGFGKLLVWVDADQNGRSGKSELRTLKEAGIASIGLKGQATGFSGADTADSYVKSNISFTWKDGSTGSAYDVQLGRKFLGKEGNGTPDGLTWADAGVEGQLGRLNVSGDQAAAALNAAAVAAKTRKASETSARGMGSSGLGTAGDKNAAGSGLPTDATGVTASAVDESLAPVTDATSGLIDFSGLGGLDAESANRWADRLDPLKIQARKDLEARHFGQNAPEDVIYTNATLEPELTGRGDKVAPGRHLAPIIVDFGSKGLDLLDPGTSKISLDVDHDGVPDQVGWFGASQGALVRDVNGDGKIDPLTELTFATDRPGAKPALRGLAAFDTNGDGVLDAEDASFATFLIWRDLNQNGVSDVGELQSLKQAGITSMALKVEKSGHDDKDFSRNETIGQVQVTMADGTNRTAYDTLLGVTGAKAVSLAAEGAAEAAKLQAATSTTPSTLPDLQSGSTATMINHAPATPASVLAGSSDQVSSARRGSDGPLDAQAADQTLMLATAGTEWWRASVDTSSSSLQNRSLSALVSPPTLGGMADGVRAPSYDAAAMQRQLLLRQRIAAFQGDSGGMSAPLWRRTESSSLPDFAANAHRTSPQPVVSASSLG